MRNLIVSGGIFHPFAESSAAIADILTTAGIESTITEDVEAGIASLADGQVAMFTLNALRWSMMTGDKYEPYRDQWAFRISEAAQRTLLEFVSRGGALLGVHTASICFDTWPDWGQLLGGSWQWGTSHHPPLGPVSVWPTTVAHAVTEGIEPFELKDEIYHELELEQDVKPLLIGMAEGGAAPQPIAWARPFGQGRVVYEALGHDAASIHHPAHRRLLRQAAAWLLNSGETES